METRYQKSVCRRGILHKFVLIKNTDKGVLERCERCGMKMHFPNGMKNHLYLSWHIRSVLRADDSLFRKEYPNITV